MHVAVVIVGYRNAADIEACLGALDRSTHSDFEVIICENGGPAAFRKLRAMLSARSTGGRAVRAVEAPGNVGYAGGLNIGIRATPEADAWWILNPDTLPDADALAALCDRLAKGDCQAVGGTQYDERRIVQSDGGRWFPLLARVVSLGRGRMIDAPVDPVAIERSLSFVSGASLLAGKEMVSRIGLMREDYFLYGEEVEWCLRAKKAGLKLGFAPGAHVLHHQGASTGSASSFRTRPRLPIFLDERNKMLIVRDTDRRTLASAAPAALALLTLRFLGRGAWRQFGYALAGWKDGVLGRRGKPGWVAD